VHDSRVRRIATITPDMVRPKPHDFAPDAIQLAARESKDNIPNRTPRVRVQIVNVNRGAKKCVEVTRAEIDLVKFGAVFRPDRAACVEPAASCSFSHP
jgi:hypothetical protein